jgi:hypothetical protein
MRSDRYDIADSRGDGRHMPAQTTSVASEQKDAWHVCGLAGGLSRYTDNVRYASSACERSVFCFLVVFCQAQIPLLNFREANTNSDPWYAPYNVGNKICVLAGDFAISSVGELSVSAADGNDHLSLHGY